MSLDPGGTRHRFHLLNNHPGVGHELARASGHAGGRQPRRGKNRAAWLTAAEVASRRRALKRHAGAGQAALGPAWHRHCAEKLSSAGAAAAAHSERRCQTSNQSGRQNGEAGAAAPVWGKARGRAARHRWPRKNNLAPEEQERDGVQLDDGVKVGGSRAGAQYPTAARPGQSSAKQNKAAGRGHNTQLLPALARQAPRKIRQRGGAQLCCPPRPASCCN